MKRFAHRQQIVSVLVLILAATAWLPRAQGAGSLPITPLLAGATPPQVVPNTFDVTMAATAFPGIGNEYLFERVGSEGQGAGWQSPAVFTDFGLPPNTEVAYRVKARDAYFAETEWSPVAKVKTAAAPAPAIWSLDEGDGKKIKDGTGFGEALKLDGSNYVKGPGLGMIRQT
jgi:hypothetical protein